MTKLETITYLLNKKIKVGLNNDYIIIYSIIDKEHRENPSDKLINISKFVELKNYPNEFQKIDVRHSFDLLVRIYHKEINKCVKDNILKDKLNNLVDG